MCLAYTYGNSTPVGDFLFPVGYVRVWPPPDGSPCRADAEASIDPQIVDVGEETTISLRPRAACPRTGLQPEHTVLILDGSRSMEGEPGDAMKAAAKALIRGVGLEKYPEARLAVVSFNVEGTTHCRFTNDEAALLNCVDEVGAAGVSHWEQGIVQAWDEIARAHADDPEETRGTKVSMVLFSQGWNSTGCPVLELVLDLPSGLEYVAGSASIRPHEVAPNPLWRLEALPAEGVELTLRVGAVNDSMLTGTMTAFATLRDATVWTYPAALELPVEFYSVHLPTVVWYLGR